MAKDLEERIEKVEKEIERLKEQANGSKPKSKWIIEFSGSFKDDVEFDEIIRLGRKERVNDQVSSEE